VAIVLGNVKTVGLM